MQKSPDAITRAVIAQPVTGAVWDAGGREVLGSWQLSTREEYFQHGAGSDALQSREHTGVIDAVPERLSDGIKVMRNQGCPVVAIILSWNRHTLWLEESDLNTVPQRRGVGQLATEQVVLANRITFGHIYQSQNLLADFPWHCAQVKALYEDSENPGTITGYRLYRGNSDTDLGWKVTGMSGEPSVSMEGVLDAQGGQAVLEFIFPVPSCQLLFDGQGKLEVLSWEGNLMAQAFSGDVITVPPKAWSLKVTAVDTAEHPALYIQDVGRPVGYRPGVCNDCDDPEDITPPWALNDLPWIEPSNIQLLDAQPLTCYMDDILVLDGQALPWIEPSNIRVLTQDDAASKAFTCYMDSITIEFEPNELPWIEPSNITVISDEGAPDPGDNSAPTISWQDDTQWDNTTANTLTVEFDDPDGDDLEYVEFEATNILNATITSWLAQGWNGSSWENIPAQTPGGAGPFRVYNTTPGYSRKRILVSGFAYDSAETGDTAFDAAAEARDALDATTTDTLNVTIL